MNSQVGLYNNKYKYYRRRITKSCYVFATNRLDDLYQIPMNLMVFDRPMCSDD